MLIFVVVAKPENPKETLSFITKLALQNARFEVQNFYDFTWKYFVNYVTMFTKYIVRGFVLIGVGLDPTCYHGNMLTN